jgi:DNA-binding Lrp family transcriptional regulator
VYTVAGRFDLAVVIRVRDNEQLEDLVTDHLLKLEAIRDSETHIAFKAHSRFDLEKIFLGKSRPARTRRNASTSG